MLHYLPSDFSMASSTLNIGQRLTGRCGVYSVTKQIYEPVWLAMYAQFCCYPFLLFVDSLPDYAGASDAANHTVVIKSVRHILLHNECSLLKRFQQAAPLRPLLDEIRDPPILRLLFLGTMTVTLEISRISRDCHLAKSSMWRTASWKHYVCCTKMDISMPVGLLPLKTFYPVVYGD